jgi:glycosyltransferase involved in cell wall biosynthesis
MMKIYEENPDHVTEAEIIVGIPSYNEADLIHFPTKKASEGLTQFYPDRSSVIINCDNHSTDGTREAFLGVQTDSPKIYLSTPEGIAGKGNNFRNLFRKAVDLKAKAIIVVDADLKSITPRWIKNLGDPIFENFGFVAPLYVRHRFDGTITNTIAYPLTRALYGRRVRQPIGGDFGVSGDLAKVYLQSKIWEGYVSQFGIDIWMTTVATNHRIRICQSFMGRPKVHKPKDPAADLGPMFNQVVGTIFSLMDHFAHQWKRVKWSKPTAIFGFGLGETEMPPEMTVNKERLYTRFTDGVETMIDEWKTVLTPHVFSKLMEVAEIAAPRFDFPTELWAKILFDCAIVFRRKDGGDDRLLDSLQPLYYGKVLSYINKVEAMSTQQAEEYIEDQCIIFEETKPYLTRRWNGPARRTSKMGRLPS